MYKACHSMISAPEIQYYQWWIHLQHQHNFFHFAACWNCSLFLVLKMKINKSNE